MTSRKNKKENVVSLKSLIIPKFWPIFTTDKTHIIITTGRAGTKSSAGSIDVDFSIMEDDNCSAIVLRKFHNKLKKTVYKEALRAITRLGQPKRDFKITVNPMEIKYKANQNTIYFTGSDSIDDTKGIIDENKPIKIVLVDELTEFFDKGEGEDELQNIEATFVRGNASGFKMIYLYNPPKNPKHPVTVWKDKMIKRDDVLWIHADYRDVPVEWLGEELIKSAEQLKQVDEKMYRWLWLGEAIGIDDVIYYMFDEQKHVKQLTDYESIDYIGIGIDYGQKNATTFQAYGLSVIDKKVYGIDEYYYSGRDEGKQKSPSEYAKDFKEFRLKVEKETGKKALFVYIDPSAEGLAEEIRRVDPGVPIHNANNDVALGISRVSKLLSYGVLLFSPKQKHQIEEMYLYQYNEDLIEKGREEPIKQNDHCCDATRYLIMGFWKTLKVLLPYLKLTERGDDE